MDCDTMDSKTTSRLKEYIIEERAWDIIIENNKLPENKKSRNRIN